MLSIRTTSMLKTPGDVRTSSSNPSTLSGPRRAVFFALGSMLLAIGTLGTFVPGLPTTVFVLAASYCFARSSQTTQRWLLEHPRWGAYIRAAENRCMSRRAKVSALALMWTSISVSSVLTAGLSFVVSLSIVAAGVVGSAVILCYVRTAPETDT